MKKFRFKHIAYTAAAAALFTAGPAQQTNHKNHFSAFKAPKVRFGQQRNAIPANVKKLANLLEKEIQNLGLNSAQAGIGHNEGDTTYYPADMFSTLKGFMDPLPDGASCDDQDAGMIASVNCHLSRDIGVDGVGSYTGNMDGGTFTIEVSAGSSYDYLVEGWVDFGANKKFMNYWLDEGGQRGKLEMFPMLPGNQSNTFAMLAEWDSRTASNQTLSMTMEQLADDSSSAWSNRQFAGKLSGARNENTGVVELTGGISQACVGTCQGGGSNFDAFKIQMVRNSTYTAAQGSLCDADSTGGSTASSGCSAGGYVCFQNSDKIIIDADSSFANVIDEECSALTTPSIAVVDPYEDAVGLFSDSDDDVFTLDESDS